MRTLLLCLLFCFTALLSCSDPEPSQPEKGPESEAPARVSRAISAVCSPDPEIREKGKAALLRQGSQARAPLARHARHRLDTGQRDPAMFLLLELLGRVGGQDPVKVLLDLLRNSQAALDLRMAALHSLRRQHQPHSLPHFCTEAEKTSNPEMIRVGLIAALGDHHESDMALKTLLRLVCTGSDRERAEAARSLLCFEAPVLAQAFRARFFDRSWRVRILAVEYARRHLTPQARRQLEAAQNDRNLQVALAARKALDETR